MDAFSFSGATFDKAAKWLFLAVVDYGVALHYASKALPLDFL